MRILLDAGPSLNFMAVGQENILIQAAKFAQLKLAAPERVDIEVRGKCRDHRFARRGALNKWTTLTTAGRIDVLSDELVAGAFTEAIGRISGKPAQQRVREKPSLGEIMVSGPCFDTRPRRCERLRPHRRGRRSPPRPKGDRLAIKDGRPRLDHHVVDGAGAAACRHPEGLDQARIDLATGLRADASIR